MSRLSLALAAMLLLAAGTGLAAAAAREPTGAERLTQRIQSCETKLRTEKDPDARKALAEDLEQSKHTLGPTDAAGKRIKCQAMWHDAALRDIDAQIKRLGLRARPRGGAAAATDARLAVRQMAAIGLERGWSHGGALPKYQFDALGACLYNNLPMLDRLFDEAATHLARETASASAKPEAQAAAKALADIKDGAARMVKAVEDFGTIDTSTYRGREQRLATLPAFVAGLRTVHEANRALGAERPKTGEAADPAPPPGLTEKDKTDIEKTQALLASVKGEGWAPICEGIGKLVAIAEAGLKVPAARSSAGQLLDTVARLAAYIKELTTSKAAYASYVTKRQETIERGLEYLKDPSYRRGQYSRLRLMCEGDDDRRALDRSPLSPDACQGYLRANRTPYSAFVGERREVYYERFQADVATLIDVLGRIGKWPPPNMSAPLKALYSKGATAFLEEVEFVGKAPQEEMETYREAVSETAVLAGDIRRLVQADEAVKAVAKYAPDQAPVLCAEVVRWTERIFLAAAENRNAERRSLDQFLAPFRELADLRLPGPEHAAIAARLSGGTCKAALTFLGSNLTRNLASAAKGNSRWLDDALDARSMFHLIRHRSVAEKAGLSKLGTIDLEPFSAPDKPWNQFVTALDTNLRVTMKEYGNERRRSQIAWQALSPWDRVFCVLAAARHRTRVTRQPGEGEMDRLMRHLEQVADPNPPDTMWFGWAAGYHGTEAAVCLASGYEQTAGWHMTNLNELRRDLRFWDDLTWREFDPPE